MTFGIRDGEKKDFISRINHLRDSTILKQIFSRRAINMPLVQRLNVSFLNDGEVKVMELCSVFISCTVTTVLNPFHTLGHSSRNEMTL